MSDTDANLVTLPARHPIGTTQSAMLGSSDYFYGVPRPNTLVDLWLYYASAPSDV